MFTLEILINRAEINKFENILYNFTILIIIVFYLIIFIQLSSTHNIMVYKFHTYHTPSVQESDNFII